MDEPDQEAKEPDPKPVVRPKKVRKKFVAPIAKVDDSDVEPVGGHNPFSIFNKKERQPSLSAHDGKEIGQQASNPPHANTFQFNRGAMPCHSYAGL